MIKLGDIIDALDLEVIAGKNSFLKRVFTGYVGDLYLEVLSKSNYGDIWITSRIYHSIVAIAKLKGHVGIIVIDDNRPDGETIREARDKDIPLFTTSLSAFEVAGRLYGMGVRGSVKK
jgi:hypothetical protein